MPNSQQRRDAARRQLEKRLSERQARQEANRKRTLVLSISGTVALIVVIIVVIAVTAGGSTKKTPAATGTTTPATAATTPTRVATYPCNWETDTTGTVAHKVDQPVTATPPKTGFAQVTVKTTQGNMVFKLNRSLAPCTVESFVSLVQQAYYNNSPCHRLVTAGIYVLQCGDPTGSGSGGPGYTIPDEATGNETYPAGTIAMARTQSAHSGGSQFFIVYKDSPSLMQQLGQQQYTVFGTVSSGLDVVNKVAAKGAATGTDGKPKLPITITSMAVTG